MRIVALLLACVVLSQVAIAQDVAACGSSAAREFDFWIGDWDIRQRILRADGSWLELQAQTSVSPTLDGCALVEQWRGTVQFFWEDMQSPEPMQGLSVRAYDPQAGAWHIYWMDSRAPRFGVPYSGGFDGDRGEFFRLSETPRGERTDRITFSDITPDSVMWELAVSGDGGQTWTTLWTMEMRRAAG